MAMQSSERLRRFSDQPIHEGRVTRMVERQTGKVPSLVYFNLAVSSMILSAGLAIYGRRKEFANFVGLWAPTFLLMGIYNKLVKIEQES